ncbi:DUF1707 SHOCT-like domain-containing protein [Streptomyces sp. URMC 123]|uniref:DUF1707 SHOCT-like domain-containing protein n=1 Tax=Streptomyces sp. URMC 123 TaxID=3423403 RepID=UPI003F1D8CED
MKDPDQSQLRIGNDEREEAFEALTAHSRDGRLTIDEYGDRAEALNEARTRADVRALFLDLPEPRPRFLDAAALAPRSGAPEPLPDGRRPHGRAGRDVERRFDPSGVPIAAAAVVGLCWATGNWYLMFFMAPMVLAINAVLGRVARRRRGHGSHGANGAQGSTPRSSSLIAAIRWRSRASISRALSPLAATRGQDGHCQRSGAPDGGGFIATRHCGQSTTIPSTCPQDAHTHIGPSLSRCFHIV